MDDREYKSIIESILYVWSEPIDVKEISKIIDLDKNQTKILLDEMMDEFEHHRRGIKLNKFENSYQFSTRKEHFYYLNKLLPKKKARGLTNSSMETLSIIAYKQPVTRIEIENIRGVKSNSSIETLIKRGLIIELGRLDELGRPILYGTSEKFLKKFNLTSIKDLPKLEDFEILDKNKMNGD